MQPELLVGDDALVGSGCGGRATSSRHVAVKRRTEAAERESRRTLQVYHPNINSNGSICLEILKEQVEPSPDHIEAPPVHQLKMLNRIATVKDDGTVVVDVPSTLDLAAVDVEGEDGYGHVAVEESFDGAAIPQTSYEDCYTELTVGTRGGVQPFIAIGKWLQGIEPLVSITQTFRGLISIT